jgi:hypothetical protein
MINFEKRFKWSEDKGVWHNATIDRPPSRMIHQDKMVHVGAGEDCWGFNWSGSTDDHWHCRVNMTFDEAHEWVRKVDPIKEDYWFKKLDITDVKGKDR